MSLLESLLPSREPAVPVDDNVAQTDASDNPFLAPAISTMRSGFDSLYDTVEYFVEGKRSALKQADKAIAKWEKKLQWIVDEYKKLLDKFDDVTGGITAGLTIDIAKEAWEILQEYPIFRRYLGEANYWLLYDVVGLAAYQPASLGADLAVSVKEAVKAAIRALLAMTDGVMSLESYLGTITQWWGAFYLKVLPYSLTSSIVPNVTCAYYYKPPVVSPDGTPNPVPALNSFIPVPIPIPSADYVLKHGTGGLAMDPNNPSTWRDPVTGENKFINTEALQSALAHWGSSYTNATIPLVTSADEGVLAAYKRRDYIRSTEKGPEAHPLQVGKSFAQLDTSMTEVAYQGGGGNNDDAEALAKFEKLWQADDFQAALRQWSEAWDSARAFTVGKLKEALHMKVPKLDANGNAVGSSQAEFVSMKQIWPAGASEPEDERAKAFGQYMRALFSYEGGHTLEANTDGSPALKDEIYQAFNGLRTATLNLITQYLQASGLPDGSDTSTTGMSPVQYRLGKSRELSMLLAQAAAAMRAKVPVTSAYHSASGTVPLLSKSWDLLSGGRLNYASGLSHFARMLPEIAFPRAQRSPVEGYDYYRFEGDSWHTVDSSKDWVSLPAWGSEEVGTGSKPAYWGAYLEFLVYPALQHPMPRSTQMSEEGLVLDATLALQGDTVVLGSRKEGVLADPRAWTQATPATSADASYPTCGFFVDADIDKAPITVVGALVAMMDERASMTDSLSDEIAEEVGYSVLKGVQPLAACFDVYGRLIKMAPWCFQAMPTAALPSSSPTYNAEAVPSETFTSKYARIEKGSSLWYEIKRPSHVVFRHSSFYSPSTGMSYTIYHEAMASKDYSRGDEHYTFYVFPTESVSVQQIKDVPGNASLGNLREIFEGDDGKWSFVIMKNAVPKCPKYVESDKWSFMDILNELYLLAWGASPIWGDNGARLARLDGILDEMGIEGMGFIGQLPEDNGKHAELEVGVFNDFADRIEKLVGSVYELRAKLLAATEAW